MRISDWSSDVCSSDLPASDYTLRIVDPTGNAVQEREHVSLSAFGAIDGELKLADRAPVGWYRFALVPSYAKDLTLAPIRLLVSAFLPAPFPVRAPLPARPAPPNARLQANPHPHSPR